MLAITAKVRLLKKELIDAIGIYTEINLILNTIINNKIDVDYRKKIGTYAVQTPDWKILIDEKNRMKDIVRQICTGEKSLEEAIKEISSAINELDEVSSWIQIPEE